MCTEDLLEQVHSIAGLLLSQRIPRVEQRATRQRAATAEPAEDRDGDRLERAKAKGRWLAEAEFSAEERATMVAHLFPDDPEAQETALTAAHETAMAPTADEGT